MKPRFAVIGSNGYLAKHVAKELFRLHYDDTILVDIGPPLFFTSARHVQWDVREKNEGIIDIIKDCEYVFCFAGLTGTVQSINQYSDFIQTNEIGLLNLLEPLRMSGLTSKVIFPSTRLVYKGKTGQRLKEGDEKECKTVYAMNKLACEAYLKIYHDCFDTRYTIFRICVPYGNTLGKSLSYGSLKHFFDRARENKNVIVYGEGLQRRTFTHVSDIARIVVSGSLDERTDNGVFNVGGPDHLAIVDVAKRIADRYGVGVDFRDWTALDSATESGDTMFDSSKLDDIVPPLYQYTFDQWMESDLDAAENNH